MRISCVAEPVGEFAFAAIAVVVAGSCRIAPGDNIPGARGSAKQEIQAHGFRVEWQTHTKEESIAGIVLKMLPMQDLVMVLDTQVVARLLNRIEH